MNIDPPCISIDPPRQSPYIVKVGFRLTLHCSACGFPLPTVQWYINGSLNTKRPPEFVLVPTTSAHTTVYTCVASNNAGNMTHIVRKSITVIVEGSKFTSIHCI